MFNDWVVALTYLLTYLLIVPLRCLEAAVDALAGPEFLGSQEGVGKSERKDPNNTGVQRDGVQLGQWSALQNMGTHRSTSSV